MPELAISLDKPMKTFDRPELRSVCEMGVDWGKFNQLRHDREQLAAAETRAEVALGAYNTSYERGKELEQKIAELEAKLAKAVQLTRDEAHCLTLHACKTCKIAAKAVPGSCVKTCDSAQAKLQARLEVAG